MPAILAGGATAALFYLVLDAVVRVMYKLGRGDYARDYEEQRQQEQQKPQ